MKWFGLAWLAIVFVGCQSEIPDTPPTALNPQFVPIAPSAVAAGGKPGDAINSGQQGAGKKVAAAPSQPERALDPFNQRIGDAIERFRTSDDPSDDLPVFTDLEELLEEARVTGRVNLLAAAPTVSWAIDVLAHVKDESDANFKQRISKFERWREAYPDSPLPLMGAARAYNSWAWHARGAGFAATVDEDQWRPFRLRLVEARDLLERAEKLEPIHAHLYVLRINVGRSDGSEREQIDEWLAKGREADATCLPLYREMAAYLLPRWHGEPGEVEEFAERMRAEMPGELGLNAYAAIAAQQAYFEPHSILHGGYDRATLHEAAKTVAQTWTASETMNEFAALIAVLMQDPALGQQVQKRIGSNYTSDWLRFAPMRKAFEALCKRGVPAPQGEWNLWDFSVPQGVRFLNSGDQLVTFAAGGNVLTLWDIESQRPAGSTPLAFDRANSFEKHPTKDEFAIGVFASDVDSGMIIDLETLAEPKLLYEAGLGAFYEVNYSSDGKTLLVGHDDVIAFWDLATQKVVDRVPYDVVRGMSLSPDGKRILVRTGDLYDPQSKKWLEFYDLSGKRYHWSLAAAFLDNDTIIGCASDVHQHKAMLLTWNLKTDTDEVLAEVKYAPHKMKLSPDHTVIAMCHGGETGRTIVRLFDMKSRKERAVWDSFGTVYDLDFSPDGSRLALACEDGSTRVFRVPATAAEVQ